MFMYWCFMNKVNIILRDFIEENNLTKKIISKKTIFDLNDAEMNLFLSFVYSPFKISENRIENATLLTNFFIENNYFNHKVISFLSMDHLNINNLKNYFNFCINNFDISEFDGIITASNFNNNEAINLLLNYSSLKHKAISFYNCLINGNDKYCHILSKEEILNEFLNLELQNNLNDEEKDKLNYYFNEVLSQKQNKIIKEALSKDIDSCKIKSKRKI